MRKAKIVATLGPATAEPSIIRALLSAGANVCRINMSHGDYETNGMAFDAARAAAKELNRPLAILVDLAGPKIRTGRLEGGQPIELKKDELLSITSREIIGNAKEISTNHPEIIFHAKAGARVLIEDGAIELIVEQTTETDLICRVLNDGLLGEHKGINLPGLSLPIMSITDKDREDMAWALRKGADFIGLSFVRSGTDCQHALDMIKAAGSSAKLIAKIEMAEAITNIDSIIETADAVMVARGDLGVETSVEMVPVYQKMIIEKANIAGKTVITATQMLLSMVHEPRPTRAEASDVANAVWDGTDAVMLSNETAVGDHPVTVVKTMAQIIEKAEAGRPIAAPGRSQQHPGRRDNFQPALSAAALLAADKSDVQTIAVFTETGQMARSLAQFRPKQHVIALTQSASVRDQLAAVWGVEAMVYPACQSTKKLIEVGERTLGEARLVKNGEMIILMAGRLSGLGLSSSIKMHKVGEQITDPDK